MRYKLLFLLLALVACGRRTASQGDSAVPDNSSHGDSLVILFTGDVLLDRGVRPLAEAKGVQWLFEGVDSLFHRADATVINLECPLTESVTPLGKKFIFRAEPRWADDLRRVGITHAAVANNHSNDQGRQGFLSTLTCLQQANIVPLGSYRVGQSPQPVYINKKGAGRVALFNAVLFALENWMPGEGAGEVPCQVDAQTLAEAVRRHKDQWPGDRVVCVLHWGVEFQSQPTQPQRAEARLLVEAGADAIIGHHPHVVQPLAYVHGVPVAYSLGNFVFDQSRPETNQAQMARLVVRSDTLYMEMTDVSIRRCRPWSVVPNS